MACPCSAHLLRRQSDLSYGQNPLRVAEMRLPQWASHRLCERAYSGTKLHAVAHLQASLGLVSYEKAVAPIEQPVNQLYSPFGLNHLISSRLSANNNLFCFETCLFASLLIIFFLYKQQTGERRRACLRKPVAFRVAHHLVGWANV